jgi:hypothetical protein
MLSVDFLFSVSRLMYIELESTEHGWYVRCGELWDDHLTRGEALEVVANLILTGKAPYLKTDLQHALWNLKYGNKLLLTEGKKEQKANE